MRRAFAVPALVIGALVVAGATVWAFAQMPGGIEEFNQAQASADRVGLGSDVLGILPESVRLLAIDDGTKYFAARSDNEGLCLMLVPDGEDTITAAACGGGDFVGSTAPGGSLVHLFETGMGDMEREGWRQLSPNLYVEE